MKFHLAQAEGHIVTRIEADTIYINAQPLTSSFLLFPDTGVQVWSGVPTAQLSADDDNPWQAVLDYAPNVVVIGTGAQHKFPHPSLLRPLIDARIGYEIMATPAACRTYNVLVAEGRRVCAALTL